MATNDNNSTRKSVRQRNYLARDFDGFRSVLLDYAKQYYPDRIKDFSEASVGGLFLDMAAYIGDNMSFYMDHLYNELNSDTAVEIRSVERIIQNSGVKISGAAPAIATVDFYIEVPVNNSAQILPDSMLLPTILEGTTLRATNGVQFTLMEDVEFWERDATTGQQTVAADVEISNGRRIGGNIVSKILKKSGLCTSGEQVSETYSLGSFQPYRRITLGTTDVTQIISVTDGLGNTYYEVESLSNDVVYRNVLNTNTVDASKGMVKDTLKVIPAPYRFTSKVSLASRQTTLTFGGGSADTLENGVIPDPSEFALPLPFSKTFSRVAVNPQRLLQTSTLGVVGVNTELYITYRAGGGMRHNVPAGTITNISNLLIYFPENPAASRQHQIRNTVEASNPEAASGGEDAPSADDLLSLMPAVKSSQERIVTKEDLLARVYTMPSNFGRVFRASIMKNPNNPLAAQLFIISRDSQYNLATAPDTLKVNLKRYLNSYRMISDAIDIVDAPIVNMQLIFQIVADPSVNRASLLQGIFSDLRNLLAVKNFQINQPIVTSDIMAAIYAKKGVVAVDKLEFKNIYGFVKNLQYSPVIYDVKANTRNGLIYPPPGGIFEFKYSDINIIGKTVSDV